MAKDKVKVTILSKEIIKPSQPTPKSAASIPLSLLDQLAPPIYVNVLFFYSNYSPEIPNKLKSSLSETLKHFYPLAGRIRETSDGKFHIECSDEGVEVVETRVTGADLDTIRRGQKVGLINKELLPIKRNTVDFEGNMHLPLLAVQISELDAGGFVLGVSICHLIADGASLSMFLHWWSHTAQGFIEDYSPAVMPPPRFDSASAFPPRDMPRHTPGTRYTEDMHEFAVKCFSIDSKGMERLKRVSGSQPTTRVEAVSALLWRCIQRAQGDQNNPMPLSHSVNLRKRLASVLSPESFGNLWFPVETAAAESDTARIVQNIRNAVRGVDEQFLETKAEKVWDAVEGKEGKESVPWVISSWCRMGWYDCDFGFEEPAWVAGGVTGTWNVCILIDAKDGLGVDAWLWMAIDEMEKIENDHELYQFVCSS